jgi:U6 snRNA-associated Sm-like protein LSm4
VHSLRGVICTSRDGDRFWKLAEVTIRGNNIKYLRIPEEVIDMVPVEEETSGSKGKGGGYGGGRGAGEGRGKGGGKGGGKGDGGKGGRGKGGGRDGGKGAGRAAGRGGRGGGY